MPANASFDKGAAVEEWTDTRFFRPIGLRIARACAPTAISPDHITLVALIIGLVAGRLLFYDSVALNAAGVALFIISDIFDSADGQLARMRCSATRFGKILDGISDGARFINLYVQLMARLIVAGSAWWLVVPLGVAAGLAHARQSAAVDYIRQLYLHLAERGAGEFALAEDMSAMTPRTTFQAMQIRIYRDYLAGNGRMVPRSLTLIRRLRATGGGDISTSWAALQGPVVRRCAWIGQNIRFLLLAVTVVPGYPAAFFWITLVPMSLVMVWILTVHERNAATFLPTGSARLAAAA
ncbi:MAG: CDP-alcohol phosphatidyltransferase family protein [Gemmatimonadales bacterium]